MTNQASANALSRTDVQPAATVAIRPAGAHTREFLMPAVRGAEPDSEVVHVVRPKVMIVDDEPINIEVLQDFLQEAGYGRFVSTSDSTTAMAMLMDERPDVLLLDLMMPRVGGFDILLAMQADRILRHIPVIILTASTDPHHKLEALELGASDFLGKPVDPSELVLRMRNTLAAKAYQDRLANYDALTGLPNRKKYSDHLDWALRHSKREKTMGAVLHVGLDRFKQINEAFGPATGDRLLQEVARRLRLCVQETAPVGTQADVVEQPSLSRLGNDEFALLLPVISEVANAAGFATRVLDTVAQPYHVSGQELYLTCSVGISIFPADGEEMEVILQDAGVAMHHAKQQGKNSCHFYSHGLNAHSRRRLAVENDLRKALERGEMRLFYQPKFDVQSGRLSGAEALLRWQHPERGLVGPQDFIPIAEESGLIVALGDWVLQDACRQIKAWQSAGFTTPRVSVNVSSHQFRQHRLAETVQRALDMNGVDPQYLTLEITESVIMENAQQNLNELSQIKATGVKLSIDDFGTGYSSLNYLMRFPLDELKIDRSFIESIGEEGNNGLLVVAVIAIARSLGLNVVAEGVETAPQLAFLKAQGCNECQGFLLGRPVSADEFSTMLHRAPQLVCAGSKV
jgi:diguanylate cyclase (GGDEF)-like protein